jgi:hypothetical protein
LNLQIWRFSLTAQALVDGKLLSGGALKQIHSSGNAQFKVWNGELIDFKPITNIAKFVFSFSKH